MYHTEVCLWWKKGFCSFLCWWWPLWHTVMQTLLRTPLMRASSYRKHVFSASLLLWSEDPNLRGNRVYLCVQGRETEYQVGWKLVTCIYLKGLPALKSVKAESKSSRHKELPHGLWGYVIKTGGSCHLAFLFPVFCWVWHDHFNAMDTLLVGRYLSVQTSGKPHYLGKTLNYESIWQNQLDSKAGHAPSSQFTFLERSLLYSYCVW